MSWLVGLVGAIFLIGIITGLCRGAIKITVSLVTTIVTLVLVFFATPIVSDWIVKFTPMDEVIEEKVASAISDAAISQLSGDTSDGSGSGSAVSGLTRERVEKVLKAAGISESTLEQYGISVDDIVDGKISSQDLAKYGISSNLLDGLNNHESLDDSEGTSVEDVLGSVEIPRDIQMAAIENADMPQIFKDLLRENNNSETYKELGVDTFAQYVGKFLAKIIIHVVAFLITFLLVTIVLRAIIFALDFVADLPGVGIVNRLAGGVIGAAGAAIVVWMIFIIITLLYTTSIGKSLYDTIQAEPYLRVLYEYNPIMKLATIFR